MRVRINGKSYEPAHPSQLTLGDLIELERVTTDLGTPVNLAILADWQEEFEAVKATTKDERERILGRMPKAQWSFAVNLYTTMRVAGDDVTFNDALKLSPVDVEWLLEDGDDEPDPTGRPSPRKASAAAVKRPADRAKKSRAKTSAKASTNA